MLRSVFIFSIMLAGSPAEASYFAFGDSLTDTTGQAVTGYIAQLNTALGVTFNNQAHGGDMVGDQLAKVYTVNQGAGDSSTIMLRVNDERFYGVNATKQIYSNEGYMAAIAWLAMGTKQTARAGCVKSGSSWTNATIYAIGIRATTNGDSCTFTVSGSSIYLAMQLADTAGQNGTYSVQIDGGTALNFDSSAPGVTSYNGFAFTDRLHRWTPGGTSHTIKVTKTGGSYLYVEWAGGNTQTIKPTVYVGNVIRQSNVEGIGYSEWGGSDANVASYNADTATIISNFVSDGLDVHLVDVNAALNNTTDLSPVDGIHPIQPGHNKLFSAFLAAMPAVTFTPAATYLGSDGKYYIGADHRQLQITP